MQASKKYKKESSVFISSKLAINQDGKIFLDDWKERFRNQLINAEISELNINQMLILADQGKQHMLQKELLGHLGKGAGKKFFERYKENINEFTNLPMEGSEYIREQQKLQLYRYPQKIVTEGEKYEAKTVLVLGGTGSGKSTLLNLITNYLAGTQINDPFRYQIAVKKVKNQAQSDTDKVTAHFVKDQRTGDVYRIIDTPGFGDTSGPQKDQETIKQLKNLLKNEIKQIHCVLFIARNSDNRITQFQKYVFQCLMELFGRDIVKNLTFVITFSDFAGPKALGTVKDKEAGFGEYWQQISEPKYIQVNSLCAFQKADESNIYKNIVIEFWDIAMKSLNQLFQKIKSLQGNNLELSKQLMRKKQILILKRKESRKLLQKSIHLQAAMKKQIENLSRVSDEINQSRQSLQKHVFNAIITEPCSYPVMKCKNCPQQNCHKSCSQQSSSINKCKVIDTNGNCTICQKRCPASDHFISKQIRCVNEIAYSESVQNMKNRYNFIQSERKVAQNIIKILLQHLDEQIISSLQIINEIATIECELKQIGLSKNPVTISEYLQLSLQKMQTEKNKNEPKIDDFYFSCAQESKRIQEFSINKLKEERQLMIKLKDAIKQSSQIEPIKISNQSNNGRPINNLTIPFSIKKLKSEQGKQQLLKIVEKKRLEMFNNFIIVRQSSFWQKIKQFFIGNNDNQE